jgi:peptide-methionine (S)-S-oxide reductase
MKATFGAGCFWSVELAFSQIPGVTATVAGYMGGALKNPTYKDVCTDETGHAEVVQIEFDPKLVSYEQLLDVFWSNHNPTTLNRQGPDVGRQYRSVIFSHTPEQRALAERSRAAMQERLAPKKIVTAIEPAAVFYRAEEYHQQYLRKRGMDACHY